MIRQAKRPTVGILVLDTVFPRIPGDAGNAATWDFPVRYKVVRGAYPSRVIGRSWDRELLEPFLIAAQELEREGAAAITTTCGFLSLYQQDISRAVKVPVFVSSLLQVPWVYRLLKEGQIVGILTVDSRALSSEYLAAVGAEGIPVAIAGTEEGSAFTRTFAGNRPFLDPQKAQEDLVETALRLVKENPTVGAVVLECSNMPPYARAVQEAIGLPVFDLTTLTNYIYQAIVRNDFVTR